MQGNRHDGRNLPPCTLVRRLLAIMYDSLIVLAMTFLAAFVALPVTGGRQQALRDPGLTLYLLSVWFAYLGWCWRSGGATVGMRAWRIRLATPEGRPPSWFRCLLRFLTSLLSAAAFGLGFAWSLFDPQRRTWHDRASGTFLVIDRPTSDRASQHQEGHHGKQR